MLQSSRVLEQKFMKMLNADVSRLVIYAKFIPSKKHWNITPIVADDTVIFVAANYKTDNNVKNRQSVLSFSIYMIKLAHV